MKNFFKSLFAKLKSLDKGTVFRTIMLVLGWANQVVAIIGSTTFATALWYQITSVVVTILISAVTYWYNNDWTSGAMLARDIFDMLKDGKITEEECQQFIEEHKNPTASKVKVEEIKEEAPVQAEKAKSANKNKPKKKK